MTRLHLDGVALRQYDEPYPFDYSPYAHQLALRELVRSDEEFVTVNDSPTGGGKTSSWLAPALEEEIDTIAIYPTNALVVDQTEQVLDSIDAIDHDVEVLTATAEELSEKRSEFSVQSNGEVVDQWYRKASKRTDQVILLTNPDIFVMFCRDLYRNPNRAYKQFPFIVIDEFHRAGRKEQNTLRYLLDELYERDETQRRLRKIAFLSATPDQEQEHRFEHAMAAPYHRVTEDETDERRAFSDSPEAGWKSVMPPVELDVRTAPTFGTADVLLDEDIEDLLTFCRGEKNSDNDRIAVILDGIHEVKRVFDRLNEELDRNVERIDGFHSEGKKEKLENFEVLVSNSAVEVGIDFNIDRLLFAGHNRSSFLQRLGRLRNKSRTCHARCYVPPRIARKLEGLHGGEFTRADLDDVLDDIYPTPRKPMSFGWRYSAPEELQHLDNRLRDATSRNKESMVESSRARIKRHFLDGTVVNFCHDDLRRAKESIDWELLEELQWYRGDSIQALVFDRLENTIRTYGLFYLLRYGKVEFQSEEEFKRTIPPEFSEEVERKARYIDGFCTYRGTIETTDEGWGRSVAFSGPRLAEWLNDSTAERSRMPRTLGGIKITASPNEGQCRVRSLDILNKRLQSRRENTPGDGGGLLCYPVSTAPKVVKERYGLGDFFFLYPVALQGKTKYSLALGTDALYLHCHVMEELQDISNGEGLIGL